MQNLLLSALEPTSGKELRHDTTSRIWGKGAQKQIRDFGPMIKFPY